jgi:hypothetical protein
MKQKYVALRMYLIGLTVGMFILGWSAVTNSDAISQANSGNQTASSTVTTQSRSSSQIVAQPRIRTRSS